MASSNYDIVTRILIDDRSTRGVRQITSQTEGLRKSLLGAVVGGNLLARGIETAFRAVGGAVRTASQAIQSLVGDMVDLNQEFEDQRLALTALINSNLKFSSGGKQLSPGQNLVQSSGLANDQLQQFIQAAKTSPGTSRDFSNIAQFAIDPFLKSGGKLGQGFTDFIKKTLIAGSFTGQGNDMTALDIQQLLQGQVTSRDRLPKLLGIDSGNFNKLAPDKRLEKINESLNKVVTPETSALLENTFTTIRSTFSDLVDSLKRIVGNKVFESVKNVFKGLNEFLNSNNDLLSAGFGTLVDGVLTAGKLFFDAVSIFFLPVIDFIKFISSGTDQSKRVVSDIIASFDALSESFRSLLEAFNIDVARDLSLVGFLGGEAIKAFARTIQVFVNGITLAIEIIKLPFLTLISLIQSLGQALSLITSGSPFEAGKVIGNAIGDSARGQGAVIGSLLRKQVSGVAGGDKTSSVGLGNAKVPQITQNFNGGITIKQEFKENADPDRIAFKVKEAFEKLKSRPLSSNKRFSFGGA